jgi:hypothetical protein
MSFFISPEGHRCYTSDTDHAVVARWLRERAMTGFVRGMDVSSLQYRNACTCGVNLPKRDDSVSLILTRDMVPGEPTGWHFSICCVTSSGYRGYQPAEGEHWAGLIFGPLRSRVHDLGALTPIGAVKHVHHFRLDCDWNNTSDPAVALEQSAGAVN